MSILIVIFLIILLISFVISKISKPSLKKSTKTVKPLFSKLVYSDTKGSKQGAYIIKSEQHRLRGKPDIIYKSLFSNKYIPLELKSGSLGKNSDYPREGDLMQLIAYFFMIQETFSCKVPYGKLVYADCVFVVYNSKNNKHKFLSIINEMNNFQEDNFEFEINKKVCNSCSLRHTVCEHFQN